MMTYKHQKWITKENNYQDVNRIVMNIGVAHIRRSILQSRQRYPMSPTKMKPKP